MPIIAVMNRKGGSGKSTLTTQIAAWYASNGSGAMLGDSDRQRSASGWLSRRGKASAPITAWSNDLGRGSRSVGRTTPVVVDTTSGIHGLDLAKQIARVDAIVVPVGPSVFDLETSIDFLEELRLHPRVASGRCQVGVIGMRWPHDVMQAWQDHALPILLPLLTVIPEAAAYRLCMENGGSVFDNCGPILPNDLRCWQPLLHWLDLLPQVRPHPAVSTSIRPATADVPPDLDHRRTGRAVSTKDANLHPAKQRASQQHPRSPESFVETLPPEDISPAELLAVRLRTRRQVELDTGMAAPPEQPAHGSGDAESKPSHKQGSTLKPGSGTHGDTKERSGDGWLTRIFRAR